MVDPEVVGDGVADVDRESEKRSRELDDVRDRDELRRRFDMLLQEVRVGLPGVQVLAAFLLTAPFSQRFGELDEWGKRAFGVALASSMLSVILMLGPALLHHLGERTARSQRLAVSIVLFLLGLGALAVALLERAVGRQPVRLRHDDRVVDHGAHRRRDRRGLARAAANAAAAHGRGQVAIGSVGSAAHSLSELSYTATSSWPSRCSTKASLEAAMPPPQ